nr:MAG TPA: hypothetical protein [Caudoviricetes sp.]
MALSKTSNKVQIGIILTKAQHAALQAEADRTGTNVSAIMRAIISDWIDGREHKNRAEA